MPGIFATVWKLGQATTKPANWQKKARAAWLLSCAMCSTASRTGQDVARLYDFLIQRAFSWPTAQPRLYPISSVIRNSYDQFWASLLYQRHDPGIRYSNVQTGRDQPLLPAASGRLQYRNGFRPLRCYSGALFDPLPILPASGPDHPDLWNYAFRLSKRCPERGRAMHVYKIALLKQPSFMIIP